MLRAVIGPRLKRVQRRIVRGGVLAIAAIRLVPIAPFTVVNLVAGASEIRLGAFMAGTIIGMLPGWLVMSALGHQLMRIISAPSATDIALLAVVIATPDGPLRFVATHLGLSTHERRNQTKTLLDIAGQGGATTVVAGDFNDWFWAGSVRSALSRVLPACTGFRTFPSLLPLLRLDRIYCRPAGALVQAFTDRTARRISDHLPVIADVRVSPVG